MLIILGSSVTFFFKRVFFCKLLINLIVSLIKKYNIYLYGPTYFSKNSKNHSSNDTWLRKHVVMPRINI